MGTVFLAEQDEPVRRRVALKVIRAGMDSRGIVARFEAERRALELMDHPNIARVLDAGTTPAGRPFFVMELVQGVPITEYCDQHRLNPRQRLELFLPVCAAIQHAHQKGIIHRDIKPSNVLVADVDGRPTPKVIDFGIARAIDRRADQTLVTLDGAVLGTPEYMSPEHAAPTEQDIDTRSDIYSLGVLLYELLTATTPLDRNSLRRAALAEVLRRVREEDPPTPSTRLSDTTDRLPSVAAVRGVEPSRLSRLLRGDLDWIVMKALDKDRARRYDSASSFAADLRRHLDGDPVAAGPPSRMYRLRKFSRKHRAALSTAAAFLLVLLAATAISTYEAWRAMRAEKLARQRLEAVKHADEAKSKALAESDAVTRFLVDAFRRPDPDQDGREVKVVDILDQAVASLETGFVGSPELKGAILHALAQTYLGLGLPSRAVKLATQTCTNAEIALGYDAVDALRCRAVLARAYQDVGRTTEAIRLFEVVLEKLAASLGVDHTETLACSNNLGDAYRAAGRTAESITLSEAAVKRRETRFGRDHESTIRSRHVLAHAYWDAGRLAEAIRLKEETLGLVSAKLGPDNPDVLSLRRHLAMDYWKSGRLDRSVPLFEQVLRERAAKLGPDHTMVLQTQADLGVKYRDAGRREEGARLMEDALRRALGRPDALAVLAGVDTQLALTYASLGRREQAEPLFREAIRREQKIKPDDPDLAGLLAQLGLTLLKQGKWSEAEPVIRECLKIRAAKLPESWLRFDTMSQLGGALTGLGRCDEAEPLVVGGYEGMKVREATIPPEGRDRLPEAAERVVRLCEAWGKQEKAAEWRTRPGVLPGDVFARQGAGPQQRP